MEDKFIMSVYNCCNIETSSDEDGRQTHYGYDDMGRLTDTWTDITSQSQTSSLVKNEYDSFGNIWRTTTRSDANTAKQTSYVFDRLNRVTRIDYPSPLVYEEFGYDVVSNMIWKRDGNNKVTLYK